jgi:hypothetical protein
MKMPLLCLAAVFLASACVGDVSDFYIVNKGQSDIAGVTVTARDTTWRLGDLPRGKLVRFRDIWPERARRSFRGRSMARGWRNRVVTIPAVCPCGVRSSSSMSESFSTASSRGENRNGCAHGLPQRSWSIAEYSRIDADAMESSGSMLSGTCRACSIVRGVFVAM